MSQECDDPADVYRSVTRRARQSHRCGACRLLVAPGERYQETVVIYKGGVSRFKRCGRCEIVFRHLVTCCDKVSDGDLWPDERLNCGRSYQDEWGEEPPETISAVLFATGPEASALLEVG